jgi:hypothetical protein
MSVRGVQVVSGEPIALGIVISLGEGDYTRQDDTRVAFALARDLLNDGDGCVAVNASGFSSLDESRSHIRTRQSNIAEGRRGCLPLLQDLADRFAVWRLAGESTGWVGYTWAGVRRALQDLDRDPRLRRAIIVFGKGTDLDHSGLPRSLKKQATDRLTPVFSLYFPPVDRTDPKVRAKWTRITGNYSILPMGPLLERLYRVGLKDLNELTRATGGQFYEVNEETILPIAKEIVAGLRQQCQLTYEPPADGAPGFRKIEVTISTPGWKVRNRPGYYPDQVGQSSKP